MNKKILVMFVTGVVLIFVLAACGLTEEQVEGGVQTVESMSSSELAQLSSTVEALPPEVVAGAATSAAQAGFINLNQDQINAAVSTVAAARSTATAVGAAAAAGERVNATEVPNEAPIIRYFFAQIPTQEQAAQGMKYWLNYTVENANRVEIYGNVLPDPSVGAFPVYDNQPSDDWTLWAGNETAWVEQFLQVRPDSDTGSTLQNVTVNGLDVTLSIRDPQFVDGDIVNIDVNGTRMVDGYWVNGRYNTFQLRLQPGDNTITIQARHTGATPPLVSEISLSGVTAGPAVQWTRGLNQNETQSFTVTAP